MKRNSLTRRDWIVLGSLLLFALAFRLESLMMINTGVDERDYWQSARALALGLPYPELSHRTTRFSLILPVAATQLLLGSGPNVYYVMPLLNALLQIGLAFLLGLRLRGRTMGFLAGLALALFPYMARAGSQVRPEIFSMTYVLLALFALLRYFERDEGRLRSLALATGLLFLAYEAKITNLFFVPGFALAILVYKRRPKDAALLLGGLFGLFVLETLAYALFSPFKFGELEIILQKHFHGDSFTVPSVLALLERYSPRYLQAYWSLPFALFGLGAIVYLLRGRSRQIKVLILGALSFFLFETIAVKGLHPVTPAEAFINRYFSAVLIPVFLVLAYFAAALLERLARERRAARVLQGPALQLGILGLGFLLALVLPSLPGAPRAIRNYLHSPFAPAEHPLALNEAYRREIGKAYAEGLPIVSGPGLAGENAILSCSAFFIDPAGFVGGRPPLPRIFEYGGGDYHLLARPGVEPGQGPYLAALRSPFRVAEIGGADLPSIVQGGVGDVNE